MEGNSEKIKVLIVDDHPILVDGLKVLFNHESDLEVCGSTESANAAIGQIEKLKPHLVLVDINLNSSINGIELIRAIKTRFPSVRTLALSMYEEELYASRAIRAGAMGYVMKSELTRTLLTAIRKIMSGKIYLSEEINNRLLEDLFLTHTQKKPSTSLDRLTNRELDIFQMIGKGMKTMEIAKTLNLSPKTIDAHRFKIKEKLQLKSSSDLTKFAIGWTTKR